MATRLIQPIIRPSYRNKAEYIASLMTPKHEQFPLKRVSVESVILGGIVSSVVVQEFRNDRNEDALEVVYTFPLSANGSVVRFEATIDNQKAKSVVYERAYAYEKFKEAREKGHFASVVTQERDHIYTITLTRVPARTNVKIELQVIEILTPVMGEYQYRMPTVIPHYFMPGEVVAHEGDGVQPDTTSVTDASRISPPVHLSNQVPFHFNIKLMGQVSGIKSSMHLLAQDLTHEYVVLTPAVDQQPTLNGDLVVYYRYEESGQLKAFYQDEFALLQIPVQDLMMQKRPRRLLILMDISGSMSGQKLDALKEASTSLLKTLSSEDVFQLAVFDDHCTLAFDDFLRYDNDHLAKAEKWIKKQKTRGGTDIREALSVACKAFKKSENRFEDLILLVTDGESGDEQNIVEIAKNTSVQIFTLGIDTAVNDSLLQKIARYSGGGCELCTPNADLEHIVNRLSPSMYAPLLRDLQVNSPLLEGYTLQKNLLRNQSAMLIIKNKQRWNHQSLMALEIKGIHYEYEKVLKVSDSQEIKAFSELDLKSNLGKILPYAWAKDQLQIIKEMMKDDEYASQAKELAARELLLSKEYQLICGQTALFLEIEEVKANGELVKFVQPVEKPVSFPGHEILSQSTLDMLQFGGPIAMLQFSSANLVPRSVRARSGAPTSLMSAAPKAMKKPARKKQDLFSSSISVFSKFSSTDDDDDQDLNYDGGQIESLDDDLFLKEVSHSDITQDTTQDTTADIHQYPKTIALLIRADGSIDGDLLDQLIALSNLILLGHTRISGDRSAIVTKLSHYLQTHEAQYKSDPHFITYQFILSSLSALESLTLDETSFKESLKNQIDINQIKHAVLSKIYQHLIKV